MNESFLLLLLLLLLLMEPVICPVSYLVHLFFNVNVYQCFEYAWPKYAWLLIFCDFCQTIIIDLL